MNTLADWLGREPEAEQGLTPARRLQSVSEDVRKLADMEIDALERLTGEKLASKRTSLLARCTKHLEQLPGMGASANSATWSEFLSQTQGGLIDALQTPEPTPVASLLAQETLTSTDSVKQMGSQLADALSAWPEICEAAEAFRPK